MSRFLNLMTGNAVELFYKNGLYTQQDTDISRRNPQYPTASHCRNKYHTVHTTYTANCIFQQLVKTLCLCTQTKNKVFL